MPETPLIIRPSRDSDLTALAEIYADAVRHGTGSFEIEPPDAAEIGRRRAAILDGGYPYLVAEEAGKVVGYAYAGAYRPRRGYANTVEDSVYVARNHHGKRIGHRLLGELIEHCTQAGYRLMIAAIGDSANTASVKLHAAHKFQPAGLLPAAGWKFDRWLDVVFMARPLGVGASAPPQPTQG